MFGGGSYDGDYGSGNAGGGNYGGIGDVGGTGLNERMSGRQSGHNSMMHQHSGKGRYSGESQHVWQQQQQQQQQALAPVWPLARRVRPDTSL
jgi:hypothetical protein